MQPLWEDTIRTAILAGHPLWLDWTDSDGHNHVAAKVVPTGLYIDRTETVLYCDAGLSSFSTTRINHKQLHKVSTASPAIAVGDVFCDEPGHYWVACQAGHNQYHLLSNVGALVGNYSSLAELQNSNPNITSRKIGTLTALLNKAKENQQV